jgi:hypothetical protein
VESENGQSVNTWTRIYGNVCFLNGQSQYGFGASGAFSTTISDNIVVGNGLSAQRGISTDLGTVTTYAADPYGMVHGNHIYNVDICHYYLGTGTNQAAYEPGPYTYSDETCRGNVRYGYYFNTGSTVQLDGVTINGGKSFGNGSADIYVAGTAGMKNLSILNHQSFNNGLTTAVAAQQAAVSINAPVIKLVLHGNHFYDEGSGSGGGKQLYALIVNGVAVTNTDISANDFSGNVTGVLSLSTGGTISGYWNDNLGLTSTVSGLASFPCTSSNGALGSRIPVTDAASPTYHAALTGGGSGATANTVDAYCGVLNGATEWLSQ